MAGRTHAGDHKNTPRFSYVLSSAVLEWLLMLLLFLDGLFSYLVTKFAHFCQLQTPCLLCSRLDHILGNEKPGFYRDLICKEHKSEISSLAYCVAHRKLADVHNMCEGCLLSFATEKKSNPETFRLLLSKLGADLNDKGNVHPKLPATIYRDETARVPLLEKDPLSDSPFTRHCSCCSVPLQNKSHAIGLIQDKPIGVDSHLHLQDDHGFDRLPHIGYSELKITSDSDSEVPFSDEDNGNALVHGTEDLTEEFMSRCLQPEPVTVIANSLSTTISDDKILGTLIHHAPIVLEPLLSIPAKQLHEGESHDIGHGLEELSWSQVDTRADPPAPSEAISQHVPSENLDAKLNSLEIGHVAREASAEINLKASQIMNDSGPPLLHIHMDLNDAYRFAIDNRSSLTSPTFTEVVTGRDSSKVHENLKLLISQISASRGLESPWNDLSPSPRVNYQSDEFKFSDASSSSILHNITKRLSIERNESGLESLDGSMVSELEGESGIDRLKRQMELDRKSMSLLYKELEEERSASAIAANQAMAMITRLQEEKAAMQMEALQYQRMMEEQAEYDQEALQKLNELITRREREIQDLEAEVDSYKKQFRGESLELEVLESSRGSNPTSAPLDKKSRFYTESERTNTISPDAALTEAHLKDSLLDFEDERVYISNCLKNLEKKLNFFSNSGVYVDVSSDDAKEVGGTETAKDNIRINGQYSEETTGGNELENQEISWTVGKVSSQKYDSQFSFKGFQHKCSLGSNSDDNIDNMQYSMVNTESDLHSIGNEVLCLNERLKTLEVDRNFLEHTINSLRYEDDGIRFVQEIASHLRELRRIGITHK